MFITVLQGKIDHQIRSWLIKHPKLPPTDFPLQPQIPKANSVLIRVYHFVFVHQFVSLRSGIDLPLNLDAAQRYKCDWGGEKEPSKHRSHLPRSPSRLPPCLGDLGGIGLAVWNSNSDSSKYCRSRWVWFGRTRTSFKRNVTDDSIIMN